MNILTTPYIDTKLKTRVKLLPDQMNNDIYINLKQYDVGECSLV